MTATATADFRFLDFPFEIRKNVYISMLEGQIVHCCPDENKVHHPRPQAEDAQEEHFFDGCMQCSSTCFENLCDEVRKISGEVKWTNLSRPQPDMPAPSDILSFLLSCKTVWHEMEPLLWRYATFCTGVPQFAGFYERFLVQERPSHPITSPRAQLLQRISLVFIQDVNLANSLCSDSRFRNISSFWPVRIASRDSIAYLNSQCTNLQHLTAFVDGTAFGESLGAGGMVLPFEEGLALLQFKRLQSFRLLVAGPIDRADSEITYWNAPATHQMRLGLDATASALTEILTRESEPPRDLPPEGISSTDPDYVWLKERYEGECEGNPRLTELVLKTRLYLEKQGITTIPVADGNF